LKNLNKMLSAAAAIERKPGAEKPFARNHQSSEVSPNW
jgi:hypothetical protein